MRFTRSGVIWLFAWQAYGQTLVDLRTQAKSVDFTSANATKPFKSGTNLPATCSVGEAFFKTNAAAGSNLFACTALNTWTLQSGATTLSGDVNGGLASNTVTQIQGRAVSSATPSGGQALVWNNTTLRWEPQTAAGPQGPAGPTGPQGPTGANGAISRILNAGTALPVEAALNFTGGGCTDDPSNSRTNCSSSGAISSINGLTGGITFASGSGLLPPANAGSTITYTLDSAYALTHGAAQNMTPWVFSPTTYNAGANQYMGAMTPAPGGFVDGGGRPLAVLFNPNANNAAGPMLINMGLGDKRVFKFDGATDPAAADFKQGSYYLLIYNPNLTVGGTPNAGAFELKTLPNSVFLASGSSAGGDLSGSLPNPSIASRAVNSSKMAIVNTRRTCSLVFGVDNGSVLTNADIAPQGQRCFVPAAATVVEVTVRADAGTPSVVVAKNHLGTITDLLSSALATAAAGGQACSSNGGGIGIDGTTSCSSTLSITALASGDWIETHTATAGGTAKRMSITVTYTVN